MMTEEEFAQFEAWAEEHRELGRQAARSGVAGPPRDFGNMQRYRWWEGFCEIKPETRHPYKLRV